MNHVLLSLILLISCISSLKAQLGFSIKGGVNFASVEYLYSETHPNFKGTWRVAYGFGLEKDLLNNLSIQSEFLYSSHGFQYNETFANIAVSGNTQFSYIQIPALLKYHFSFDKIRTNLFFGPHYWMGFGNVTQVDRFGFITTEEVTLFRRSDLRAYDLGFTSGIGFDYLFEKGKLHIEGRYQEGIVDIAKDENIQIRNRNFQFLIGYTFYLDIED